MDWQHRARPEAVRYAFVETDDGDPDLPAHRKPSRRPALARPHENREHGPLPRHRGRRRARNRRNRWTSDVPGRADMLCPTSDGGFVPTAEMPWREDGDLKWS